MRTEESQGRGKTLNSENPKGMGRSHEVAAQVLLSSRSVDFLAFHLIVAQLR